ncbi:MAG: QueT transporter family protein [Lachnospiraceae bacterium]|nr:QueT transporter family protein [Lachnospiraceae bacterium]
MNNKKVQFLTLAAMIAALYVVLTFIANAFGLASGAIQVRLSEALAILPFFTPAAIPGLYIGCLLANLLTGGCLLDILVGSLASLIGALGAYAVRKWKWLVPLPTIIANALIVPFVLIHGYGLADAWWYLFLTVGAGEIISCGILGMGLLLVLRNYSVQLFKTAN